MKLLLDECLDWRRRHDLPGHEVKTQVKNGRYKDFSAALQDAAWNYFYGPPSHFEE